ncbi:MAG: hypothetical protein M1441_02105 [Candidatus Parvarchaeota archaeon]|nr:hypothetical protein [Candidatus Parvarchaeota archaeon]
MITEKLTRRKKALLLSVTVVYFVVGFFLIVFLLGYIIGANYSGLLGLLYLGAGWYILIKKNGLFRIMGVKYE